MIHERVNIALQSTRRFKLKTGQPRNNHLFPEARVFTLDSVIPIARLSTPSRKIIRQRR